MADIDAALVQQILDIPKRQRDPDVEHHRQADDLRAAVEAFERVGFGHDPTLRTRPTRLKAFLSDSTLPVAAARAGLQFGELPPHAGNAKADRDIVAHVLRARLIKTGARPVRHGRYAIFQMAAAALSKEVFAGIRTLINTLRGPPAGTVSS